MFPWVEQAIKHTGVYGRLMQTKIARVPAQSPELGVDPTAPVGLRGQRGFACPGHGGFARRQALLRQMA